MEKNEIVICLREFEINVDVICQLLSEMGALNIMEIGELTNLQEVIIYLALGWLLCEDKIRFYEEGDMVFVELINSVSGIYF